MAESRRPTRPLAFATFNQARGLALTGPHIIRLQQGEVRGRRPAALPLPGSPVRGSGLDRGALMKPSVADIPARAHARRAGMTLLKNGNSAARTGLAGRVRRRPNDHF